MAVDSAEVLVVGAGPVGLTTALLLGRRGRRVTVLERWPQPYPRPRAVHFDDEVARVFAEAGVGAAIRCHGEGADAYDWRNAAGQTLLHFDFSGVGAAGWPVATMCHQPSLERALQEAIDDLPAVQVHRGVEVTSVVDRGSRVQVEATGPDGPLAAEAAWVIGCDGANSLVRAAMGTPVTDLGFFYDWLIVDVLPHTAREWRPTNLQICDPARPTTVVSGGPGRRRWEFMRLPTDGDDFATEAGAWRMLEPWDITPGNATLERHAVYTFQARWAERWRVGRLLLAGDAAHLMPPFAGQGMCSGIRDAANLAWKLDLVLAGGASEALLDGYTAERRAHVQHAIGMSVELGKVICVMDPAAATQRDAFMTGHGGDPARILPPLPPPMLTDGLLHRAPDGTPACGSGLLSPQPIVQLDGRTGLLDEVVDGGVLVVGTDDPTRVLRPEQREFLCRIGGRTLDLACERDGRLSGFLAAHRARYAVLRPDHYVFGLAADPAQLSAQVDDLRRQLSTAPEEEGPA